jgi:hypothetical protein
MWAPHRQVTRPRCGSPLPLRGIGVRFNSVCDVMLVGASDKGNSEDRQVLISFQSTKGRRNGSDADAINLASFPYVHALHLKSVGAHFVGDAARAKHHAGRCQDPSERHGVEVVEMAVRDQGVNDPAGPI